MLNDVNKIKKDVNNNDNLNKDSITIRQSIKLFKNQLNIEKKSSTTIDAYMCDLEQFRKFLSDRNKFLLRYIKKTDVLDYQRLLIEKFKPNTVDRKFDTLCKFSKFLESMGYLELNLLENFCFKRSKNKFDVNNGISNLQNYLEYSDIRHIIECAKNTSSNLKYRDIAILQLLASTGCRRDTVLRLNWYDIDFEKQEIKLSHKKTSNQTLVKMSDTLTMALKDLYLVSNAKDGYVFLSQKGGQLKKDGFTHLINHYVNLSNLQAKVEFKITSRTFRHSFITHCLKNNMPAEKIIKFTGHSSVESIKPYVHLIADDTTDLANLF